MAGAGSGKTRVLTYRIANLLQKGASPWQILAITFTNKAAIEMKERAEKLIGKAARDVWLSTFHSFCARFLRMEIEHLEPYKKNFVIYDTADSQTLIKSCVKDANLDSKLFAAGAVLGAISQAKNKSQSPQKTAFLAMSTHDKKIAELYAEYQRRLRENNALDFDDLLAVTVELLKKNAAVREKYQERFRYILVDEYQDTNMVQYEITKLLAAKHQNICVVGDADQSIYGWRGADIKNIMSFEKDYPNARVIKLEQNYRSTKNILAAANAVIANNQNRKPKNLWTTHGEGNKIKLYTAVDERDEAQFLSDTIKKKHQEENMPYSDVTILYRTNAQSRAIEENFMRTGVPYTVVGGLKFYDRKEIKDIMAYLRLAYNPMDNISFGRIINVPKRGIGQATVQRVLDYAAENGISAFDVIADEEVLAGVEGLNSRAAKKLQSFAAMIFDFMALAADADVETLAKEILEKSGYKRELEEEDTVENRTRLENLREFLGVAAEFANDNEPTLENFLAQIALVTDLDNAEQNEDQVTLMTLHTAKGLEFPVVFMVGMDDGIFPHSRSLFEKSEMEEERRACYVGITRAEKELYLVHAQTRRVYGVENSYKISRFVSEIPPAYIEETKKTKPRLNFAGLGFGQNYGGAHFVGKPQSAFSAMQNVAAKETPTGGGSLIRPDLGIEWKAGDKARHNKFGVGTVVAVKPAGEETEIKIAFPSAGIKAFTQKYAPIEKV